MSCCFHEKKYLVQWSKKEQPKNKKEDLGITNAIAEIKNLVESLDDKVSEINQEIEQKKTRDKKKKKKEMVRLLENQLKKFSIWQIGVQKAKRVIKEEIIKEILNQGALDWKDLRF